MALVIHQTKILQNCKLYANIERNTIPTPNPEPIPYRPQYYLQSHYSQLSDTTQETLALSQQEQNIFESNTSSFCTIFL